MTAVGHDGRLVRRPVSRADPGADAVLGAFAQGRVVTLGDGTAEIAHDALLQAWPRLRGWLDEDQSSLILYGQLAEDTARWRQDGKDSSRLYRGVQLAAAQEAARVWAADPGRYPTLPAAEAGFLRASGRTSTCGRWGRRTLAGPGAARRPGRGGAGGPVGPGTTPAAGSVPRRPRRGSPGRARRWAPPTRSPRRCSPRPRGGSRRPRRRVTACSSLLAQPVRGILAARSGEVTAVASSPGEKDPGGRLPGRHDPALGRLIAPPGQQRDLGRRGGHAARSPAVARPWR